MKGYKIVNVRNGSFNFTNLRFYSKPSKIKVTLKVTTNAIKRFYNTLASPDINELNENGKYSFLFKLSFRDCKPGEIYDNNTLTCFRCGFGRYSFDPKENFCHECPANAVCKGGTSIDLNQGYWKSSETSVSIFKCTPLRESCL